MRAFIGFESVKILDVCPATRTARVEELAGGECLIRRVDVGTLSGSKIYPEGWPSFGSLVLLQFHAREVDWSREFLLGQLGLWAQGARNEKIHDDVRAICFT
jgi:hypothetical protein